MPCALPQFVRIDRGVAKRTQALMQLSILRGCDVASLRNRQCGVLKCDDDSPGLRHLGAELTYAINAGEIYSYRDNLIH